jgi:hypothetical protein
MVAHHYRDDTEKIDAIISDARGDQPAVTIAFRLEGDMVQYAHDIRRFVDAMLYKLEKNAHKGRWSGLSVDEAFQLLLKEVEELRREVGGNSVKNVLEAADVANFAMMIASIATERGR